jgi:hypothetical protein
MNLCRECGRVDDHHAHCPNAEDSIQEDAEPMRYCDYCDEGIQEGDLKAAPDHLPDDIPWKKTDDTMRFHYWCFDEFVHDARDELRP